MVKPSRFILNTDYASLKNDDGDTLSFTVPGSIVIPASGTYTNVATHPITIGTAGAPMRSLINSSFSPDLWFYGANLQIVADGTDSILGPFTYSYWVAVTRTAADVATVYVIIANQGLGTLTTESTVRTITVKLNTFIPPFA